MTVPLAALVTARTVNVMGAGGGGLTWPVPHEMVTLTVVPAAVGRGVVIGQEP